MEVFSNIYNELNARELSILLWLFIFIVFFRIKVKDDSIKKLAKAFFVKPILIIAFCFFVYVLIEVVILQKIGIWTKSCSKDLIWWIMFTGIFTIGDFQKINNPKSYFQDSIKSFLKFTLILEFLVQLNTFSFGVEFFVIIPIITFISVLLAYIEFSDNENKNLVKRFLGTILSIFGIGILIYSLIVLYRQLGDLNILEKTIEFLLPICLSLLFIPFVYFLWFYSKIEGLLFVSKRFFNEPKSTLFLLLKVSYILKFNLRSIERWKDQSLRFNLTATKDLILEAYRIKDIIKSEKFRVSTPLENGWGIQNSKEFLLEHGLTVGDYKQIDLQSEEWFACSNYRYFDGNILQNNIAYYITGNEISVNKLKLVSNFNTKYYQEGDAMTVFLEVSQLLFRKAFIMEMPKNVLNDIKISKPFHEIILGKRVSFKKDIWSTDFGYHLTFCIENI